jgi:hypothetical protein
MAAVEAEVVAADMEVEIVNVTDAEMLATFLEIVRTIAEGITTTKPTIVNRSKFFSGPPVSRCHVIPLIGGFFFILHCCIENRITNWFIKYTVVIKVLLFPF